MTARRIALGLLALLLAACGSDTVPFTRPPVLVFGFDGMEPSIVEREMEAGNLPNFARLRDLGGYSRLGTANPPESPIAWANFITGMDPGGHGIFDFIDRDVNPAAPGGLVLRYPTARTTSPSGWIPIPFTDYRFPWHAGGTELTVRGKYFWEYLTERGIPATVMRIPDMYPPKETGATAFSGMGTPDLQGAYGMASYYTDDLPVNADEMRSSIQLMPVTVRSGVVKSVVRGPENVFRKPDPSRRRRTRYAEAPLRVYTDVERQVARIDVGDETLVLAVGDWSGWVPVSFPMIPSLASAHGIVRFYLQELAPHFRLYASPVNIDPVIPDLAVATPDGASEELAGDIGRYYTQGMPENVQANRHGILDTGEFLQQAEIVWQERKRMFDWTLARLERQGGFAFFYVSSTDLQAHMLYQYMDEGHPLYDPVNAPKYRRRVVQVYQQMDGLLGRALDEAPEGTRIVAMSDHGFKPYRRQLSVNTWLENNGFLQLLYPERQGEMGAYRNVDWFRTRAYGVGFAGIYLNLRGREADGIVSPGEEAETIKDEIIRGLESLVDPKTGDKVVTKVYRREEIYHGEAVEDAPDLLVGFNLYYGCCDDSVKGSVPRALLKDTDDAWTGSHLMDPSHVPGIFFVNGEIEVSDPTLLDLPVSILAEYGIEKPEQMRGRRVWR